MRQSHSVTSKRRAGFTLVELLVVIGIIALLISILLPSLNKAREAGRRVKCLSNMRQIVMAMQMFAQDNKGMMPGLGVKNAYKMNSRGTAFQETTAADDRGSLVNWIAFQRVTDYTVNKPGNGAAGTISDQNITNSALSKYLGVKPMVTNSPQTADVSPQLDSLFRCPSDKLEGRYNEGLTTEPIYRYSYAANRLYTGNKGASQTAATTTGVTDPAMIASATAGNRFGGIFNGRIGSIKSAADRILVICQDSASLDDGAWNPAPWGSPFNPAYTANTATELLSGVHDGTYQKSAARTTGTGTNGERTSNARGNVVMADGHGEFLTRKEALSQIRTGNPYPDPTW